MISMVMTIPKSGSAAGQWPAVRGRRRGAV
jgi:hypothetical protein